MNKTVSIKEMNPKRWNSLIKSLQLPESSECFERLYQAYCEKHRHYHTIQHIDAMLEHFDQVRTMAEFPSEVEIAIWFHDAIYKPLSKSNEADSAQWAQDFLRSSGYDEQGIQRIYKMIMATAHNGKLKNSDDKLIVDIDLTILGTSPEIYNQFEINVRKEYRIVPSFLYRRKRKELLISFLNQPSIYHLEYFKDKYESSARRNLQLAIERL